MAKPDSLPRTLEDVVAEGQSTGAIIQSLRSAHARLLPIARDIAAGKDVADNVANLHRILNGIAPVSDCERALALVVRFFIGLESQKATRKGGRDPSYVGRKFRSFVKNASLMPLMLYASGEHAAEVLGLKGHVQIILNKDFTYSVVDAPVTNAAPVAARAARAAPKTLPKRRDGLGINAVRVLTEAMRPAVPPAESAGASDSAGAAESTEPTEATSRAEPAETADADADAELVLDPEPEPEPDEAPPQPKPAAPAKATKKKATTKVAAAAKATKSAATKAAATAEAAVELPTDANLDSYLEDLLGI